MRSFTFTVEDVFQIDGQGIIAVPGLVVDDDPNVFPGDPLTIIRPDGTIVESNLGGISMINTIHRQCLPIILPKSLNKSDVPAGSTITITETRKRDNDENESMYNVGDHITVEQNHRNKTPRTGTIDRKIWHHKYELWKYYINDDSGNSVTKRYYAIDFSPTENAG